MIQQFHFWIHTSKKLKAGLGRDTGTLTFTAALFTKAKRWMHSSCPLTEEWVSKMWCIYTMEYFSALKRKEILS